MRLRKLRTKSVTRTAVAALVCTTALLDASQAVAAGGDPGTLAADALSTWQTDGIVWSLAAANGVVYVGGSFDSIRPPGAARGQGQVARHNFAAFDAATGKLLPCAPSFTGLGHTVRAMKASPDGRVLYVGGSFDRAASAPVANMAAVDTAGCSVRKEFHPGVSATVRAIEATGGVVYLGGDFGRVAGQVRSRIAAVDTKGALLPFKADIDQPVRALSAAPSHGRLFVGGDFETVNGRPARSLVALNPTSGATVLSYPGWFPSQSSVKTIARDDSRFFVGAEGHGPGIYDGRIAGRLANGTMVWKDTCFGATQAVVPFKGVLYSASHAHNCNETPGGFPDRETASTSSPSPSRTGGSCTGSPTPTADSAKRWVPAPWWCRRASCGWAASSLRSTSNRSRDSPASGAATPEPRRFPACPCPPRRPTRSPSPGAPPGTGTTRH